MKFLNPFFYKFCYIYIFFSCKCIKISKILSAKYYQENKERLQKKALERYQNLSREEKEKKWQYVRGCYKNLSKDEKG